MKMMDRKILRMILMMTASTALILSSMGSSCPGTGSTAEFRTSGLPVSLGITRTWRSPVILDPGAVDATTADHHQNADTNNALPPSPAHPMSVFIDAAQSFYVAFTRVVNTTGGGAASLVTGFVTQPSSFTGTTWASSLAAYTRIDNLSEDSSRSISSVDSSGNALGVFFTKSTLASFRRPFASIHLYGNGAWNSATDIANGNGEVTDVLNSGAASVDSTNDFAVVWAQNSNAYFNEYRPNIGWKFNTTFTHTTWSTAADVADLGMDIEFDGYGNGYATYVNTTPAIRVARWRGTTATRLDNTGADHQSITNGGSCTTVYGYPRIFVASDGSAHLFFYCDNNVLVGPQNATLMYATATGTSLSAPQAFSTASRFDSLTGSALIDATMMDGTDVLPPILTQRGDKAAIGFLKSDGTQIKLEVFAYNGTGWTSLGGPATTGSNVNWADISINSNGQIAAAMSMNYQFLGFERVFGSVFKNGAWETPTILDNVTTLVPDFIGNGVSRPSVKLDDSGNAMATFSMKDTSGVRRAVSATYR